MEEVAMTTEAIKARTIDGRPVRDDRLEDMVGRLRSGGGRLALAAFSILALAIAIVYTIGGTR